jgi:hypothetical protein
MGRSWQEVIGDLVQIEMDMAALQHLIKVVLRLYCVYKIDIEYVAVHLRIWVPLLMFRSQ